MKIKKERNWESKKFTRQQINPWRQGRGEISGVENFSGTKREVFSGAKKIYLKFVCVIWIQRNILIFLAPNIWIWRLIFWFLAPISQNFGFARLCEEKYIYLYIHKYVYINIYSIHVYMYIYIYMYIKMYKCISIYKYIYTYVNIYICIHVYLYINIYIYIHICIYIYIHINKCICVWLYL